MLQQLEDERRQAEETKLYIGDVSLEDILDQGPEEIAPINHEQIQQEANQASRGPSSEEAALHIGDVETKNQLKMTSKESYSDSSDGEGIDAILKEALEDYEAQLSPPGDQLIADN